MLILGIETSCDETAAAVVGDGAAVLSSVVASQVDLHKRFGGVVPEIASRAHIEAISAVVDEALERSGAGYSDIDAVAVTYAPGLIGALLVGVGFAKALAFSLKKPLVPVHHLKAHVAANYIASPDLEPPFLCLVASGGHSHILLARSRTAFETVGKTRDDAAGEAFDKAARLLGLGYPGGAALERTGLSGDPHAVRFPQVDFADAPYDFSFSGVKTALINHLHNLRQRGEEPRTADLAASFNQALTETLARKTLLAARNLGCSRVALAGGVAANSTLRALLEQGCRENGMQFFAPPPELCGDNGAMVASQGYYELLEGRTADMSLNAFASMPL